ncbi:MAG: hypothetical protein ACI4L9_07240 [Candidatus Coproplasma sp.]
MSKCKKKVPVLTDEQFNAYIMSLKTDAASYNADGSRVIPDELNPNSCDGKKSNE